MGSIRHITDILTIIRAETREWHLRVERLVPVFHEAFSLADYRRLLELFYGFYVPFERTVGTVAGLGRMLPDWAERSKLPWLEEDLLWLGYTKADISRLQVCSLLPPLDSLATAFGALYVTEGSTLGGQLICRRLSQTMGLLPAQGASFFGANGVDTGARWKAFTTSLTGLATAHNQTVIVQSAVDTFKMLWLWLSQELKSEDDEPASAPVKQEQQANGNPYVVRK